MTRKHKDTIFGKTDIESFKIFDVVNIKIGFGSKWVVFFR